VVPESSGLSKALPNHPICFVPFRPLVLQSPEPSWVLPIWWAGTLLLLTVKQIMDAALASDDKSNLAINGVEVSTVHILLLSVVLIGF